MTTSPYHISSLLDKVDTWSRIVKCVDRAFTVAVCLYNNLILEGILIKWLLLLV